MASIFTIALNCGKDSAVRSLKSLLWHKSSCIKIQFFRALIVGGIAFLGDFMALYGFTEWAQINYLYSACLGFVLGVFINYLLSIYWVFPARRVKNHYMEFLLFVIIGLMGISLNLAILYGLTEELQIYYLYSKIIATVVIFIFNFGVRKIYLFTQPA